MQLGDKKLIVQRASIGAKQVTNTYQAPVQLQVPGLSLATGSGPSTEVSIPTIYSSQFSVFSSYELHEPSNDGSPRNIICH